MLIGIKKKFVFVANSKNASTSIEHTLASHAEIMRGGSPQHKHIRMGRILKEYHFLFKQKPYRPDTFFRFGVMRDPVDWIHSWFRYRKGGSNKNALPEGTSFETFWQEKGWNFFERKETPRLQSRFFQKPDKTVLVDYIIPYAELDQHFPRICDGLGVEVALKRKNVSRIKPVDEEVPAHLLPELQDFYREDYALIDRIAEINARGAEKLARMRAEREEA